MAYSKVFKTCQDHAIGIGAVNQYIANINALAASLDVEHGSIETLSVVGFGSGGGLSGGNTVGGVAKNLYSTVGHHDSPLIPRGIITVRLAALLGYGYAQWSGNNFFNVTNPSTGVYFISVDGLSQFYGKVSFMNTAGASPLSSEVVPYYGAGAGQTGMYVYTTTQGAAAIDPWVLVQSEFSVSIFGRP